MDWTVAWIGTQEGIANCPIETDSTQRSISAAMEAYYHYNSDDYWIEMGGERISEVDAVKDFPIVIWWGAQ